MMHRCDGVYAREDCGSTKEVFGSGEDLKDDVGEMSERVSGMCEFL